MADELDRHARLTIDRLLERKDDQHEIRKPANGLDPLRAPCPDLRAHVVHDRDAERLDTARQAEIEIPKVDDDTRLRPVRSRPCRHPPQRAVRSRNPPYAPGCS